MDTGRSMMGMSRWLIRRRIWFWFPTGLVVLVAIGLWSVAPPSSSNESLGGKASPATVLVSETLEDVDGPFLSEEREVTARGLAGAVLSDSRPPAQVRLQRVVLVVAEPEGNTSLRNFIVSSDTSMRMLDPTVSYLGVLARKALNGEVSRLRVISESGGMTDALREVPPLRVLRELNEAAGPYEKLVKALMASGVSSQSAILRGLTSQRAVTVALQEAVEFRALGRFLDLLSAFEAAVKLRNDLAQY